MDATSNVRDKVYLRTLESTSSALSIQAGSILEGDFMVGTEDERAHALLQGADTVQPPAAAWQKQRGKEFGLLPWLPNSWWRMIATSSPPSLCQIASGPPALDRSPHPALCNIILQHPPRGQATSSLLASCSDLYWPAA